MRAWIVVDLGFGDAGKGLVTDALVRRTGARVVVRYNGGAQAGHNVVTADGRHHTFAQLGAGSFVPGVRTVLGPRVVVHPTALLKERAVLAGNGVVLRPAALQVSADAPIITPYHQALNRLRECARGDDRHGSCGVGVGETVVHAERWPDEHVVAGDLAAPGRLREKLDAIRKRLWEEAEPIAESTRTLPGVRHLLPVSREVTMFEWEALPDAWASLAANVAPWVRPTAEIEAGLAAEPDVVFEGAQGVLLDQDYGFHPHTTWSRCTDVNARALAGDADIVRVGVARAWMVRHGAGPLPTEDAKLAGVMDDHNAAGPWQGEVRYGHFDAVLLRYALAVQGGVDRLVVTHLDALERSPWRAAHAYALDGMRLDALPAERPGIDPVPTLASQARLGKQLGRAAPLLGNATRDEDAVLEQIAALLGRPVDAVSRGSTAGDVEGL